MGLCQSSCRFSCVFSAKKGHAMTKKTILDLPEISGKTAFVTCDFNISLKNGQSVNNTRIEKALPTLNYLLEKNCRLIISSHLGGPTGVDPQFTLKPVAAAL